jgi:tRNA threonylcarbamoyladenosine biosynthesis protein TsaB
VRLLAIDTATENCSAALLIDGSVQSREIEMERGHAERILPMIDDLLAEAGITLQDLDAIAFGRGPGSFTGVRLAVTVTQGLAFGAGLGVVPISDLRAVAQRAFRQDATLTKVLVCNDARMNEVYWACFERGGDGLARLEGEERVSKPGEVKLPAGWSTATAAGRGFIAYADALRAAVPTVDLCVTPGTLTAAAAAAPETDASEPVASPTAGVDTPVTEGLLRLLPHAIDIAFLSAPEVVAGRLIAPEAATPIYLRDNVAHVAAPSKAPATSP